MIEPPSFNSTLGQESVGQRFAFQTGLQAAGTFGKPRILWCRGHARNCDRCTGSEVKLPKLPVPVLTVGQPPSVKTAPSSTDLGWLAVLRSSSLWQFSHKYGAMNQGEDHQHYCMVPWFLSVSYAISLTTELQDVISASYPVVIHQSSKLWPSCGWRSTTDIVYLSSEKGYHKD